MGYYLDFYSIEAKFDGVTWSNVTQDIIEPVTCKYGILGNHPMDRVADIGEMRLIFNNTATNSAGLVGYYTPGHINCRPGFKTGLEVRLRIVHNEIEVVKFIGKVPPRGINPTTGKFAANKTLVIVLDWLEQASNHYLQGMTLLENVSAERGISAIIANMQAPPPGATSFYNMESTFPTVFDTLRSRTTALSEMAKLINSELGFLYLTSRGLAAEGRFTRTHELIHLSHILKSKADSDVIITETGAALIDENGRVILANQGYPAIFDNSQRDMSVSYGKNLTNSVKFTAYPRRVDASAVLLFALQNPIRLDSGSSARIQGRYRDPAGGASEVSGINMITPVAGTHYLMNTNRDGSGTDVTNRLVMTVIFSTNGFTADVENTGEADAWITKLELLGRGIYIYDMLEYVSEDQLSISEYGIYPLSVDMKYQNDPLVASAWSAITLVTYKNSRMSVDKVHYIANRSKPLLGAFVFLEPGSLIEVKEDAAGINDRFYIQGIEFSIAPGGLIHFSYILRESEVDSYIFWLLGVLGASELDRSTRLN